MTLAGRASVMLAGGALVALVGGASVTLVGCASVVNLSRSSEVAIRTSPEPASCRLSGRDGFEAVVETPARIGIPHAAAPVTVTCAAPGYRDTVDSLGLSSSGWVWGNSALLAVTGGVAALGLVVDETLGSDRTYRQDIRIDLEAERKRPVRARSRGDGQTLELEAR